MEDDKMIEVDPKLFITCRLCLEDMGIYQIVPTVQKQIKYCFDITVELFDGLPQLLCKKCKVLLDEYSTQKRRFIDKQDSLIKQFKAKKENSAELKINESIPSDVSNDRGNYSRTEHEEKTKLPKSSSLVKCAKVKRKRIISSSSSGSTASIEEPNQNSLSWQRSYRKHYVCMFCSKRYSTKETIKIHLYGHSAIKNKYHAIINNPCRVIVPKFDKKLNTTGDKNTIMLTTRKIIQNNGNSFYHVLYTKNSNKEGAKKSFKHNSNESSDDDFIYKRKTPSKRRVSRSSNETVIIERNKSPLSFIENETNLNETNGNSNPNKVFQSKNSECINIDDSSDDNLDISSSNIGSSQQGGLIKYKSIDNIISVCRNKFLKKSDTSNLINKIPISANFESSLKHKILSIGRKIIKDNFVNCTGLLRYTEHKNLDITWLPKSASKKDLVRIRTKLKISSPTDTKDNNFGWKDLPEIEAANLEELIQQHTIQDAPLQTSDQSTDVCAEQPKVQADPIQSTETIAVKEIPQHVLPDAQEEVSAVLYSEASLEDSELYSTKLLNENPVLNPKKLPKKMRSKTKSTNEKKESQSFLVDFAPENDVNTNNFSLPIITSTTSLAEFSVGKQKEANKNQNVVDGTKEPAKPMPLLKLKPVSELMNPVLCNENQTNVWPLNSLGETGPPNIRNVFLQGLLVPQIPNVPTIQFLPGDISTEKSPESISTTECITLNTIEFPNTKTDCPFHYFRNLLLLHKINLLEPNTLLNPDYVCLLKFKVQFKQENKDKPVVLCLSLFCRDNYFCICIRDSNQIDIHMTKISANWQWEIIKVFQGEVSNKILQNAEKTGGDTYWKTKTFLCLLKSIKCV